MGGKVVEYRIVWSSSASGLEDAVNNALKDGWELWGYVLDGAIYKQAMVKRERHEQD